MPLPCLVQAHLNHQIPDILFIFVKTKTHEANHGTSLVQEDDYKRKIITPPMAPIL